jgi:hypothetical protein
MLAAGLLLQTMVYWYLAGYFGPPGPYAGRLSVYYGGLGLAYTLQGVAFIVGAIGWALPEPSERRSRGSGRPTRSARRWRAGRGLAIAGGLVAGGSQLFNAVALALTSGLYLGNHFVLLTFQVEVIPAILLGIGILLFAFGWSLRKTP